MPYEIETQDGIVIRNIPDSVRPDDPNLRARVHQIRAEKSGEKGPDPTGSFFENMAAGAGKAVVDTGRGIRQLASYAGIGDKNAIQQEIDESRQRDAALMNTGGGLVGNVGTQIGTALLPGAAMARAGGAVGAAGKAMLSAPATLNGALVQGGLGAAQAGIQPVASDESRGANMTIGGMAGAAFPVLGMAAKGVKAAVEPLYEGGRNQIIGRALRSAAGGGADDAGRAMASASELVPGSSPTAAQVANNGGIAALERAARAIDPTAYAARDLEQNAARVAALRGIAGDAGKREAAEASRNATANQLYKKAYDEGLDLTRFQSGASPLAAAEAGEKAVAPPGSLLSAIKKLGGIKNADGTMLDVTGEARTGAGIKGIPPALFHRNGLGLDDLATQLRDKGYLIPDHHTDGGVQFLKDMIRDEVNGTARHYSGYEMSAIEGRMAARQSAAGASQNLTRANDKIDALLQRPAMQEAMKYAKTLAQNEGVSVETASGSVKGLDYVKRALDDKIGAAIGNEKRVLMALKDEFLRNVDELSPTYGKARQTYAEMSKPVNQMDVGQYLLDKLTPALSDFGQNTTQKAATYAQALRDAPRTLKNSTGFSGFDSLDKVLTPQQLATTTSVGQDLARKGTAEQLGRGVGSDTVQKLAMTNILEQAGLPKAIGNFPGVRWASRIAYDGPDEVMKQRLAQVLLNPQETAKVMQNATPSERQKLLALMLRSGGSPALIGGSVGALNAQQQ